MADDTRVRDKTQLNYKPVNVRSCLLTGPFMIFSGHLLQSCHRPSVIFSCLLHDSGVAKWCFQVSYFILRLV